MISYIKSIYSVFLALNDVTYLQEYWKLEILFM